jgi:HSP20 family protein
MMTFYVSPRRRTFQRMMDHWAEQRKSPEACISASDVYIPIDVTEEKDWYEVTALVPGIKPEDIDIQINDKNVCIQGDFKTHAENANYLLDELPNGHFNRTMTMPLALDAAKAEANVENGVLKLRIPKAEEAKPKTIKIVSK